MAISLAGHKSFKDLIIYSLPSIAMMIIVNIYTIVDGLFVSNLVGEAAFAGLNFIWPVLQIVSCIGFMIGTGGQALIGKTLGEGNKEKANNIFSMLIVLSFVLSSILTIIGLFFIDDISILMGATGELLESSIKYGRVMAAFLPALMLQYAFQSFMIIAEKRKMALIVTIIAGVTNMICDFLFIYVFKMGIIGAALGTGLGFFVGTIIPFVYFINKNNGSLLYFSFKGFDLKAIWQTCYNGLSELLTNISFSVANMLFNIQLLALMGSEGENAIFVYGVIMYLSFIFGGVYMGYAQAASSLVSYNYGAKDNKELSSLLKKSFVIMLVYSLLMTLLAELTARPLSMIFVSNNSYLLDLSVHTMRIYSISFLFCGFNIFASAFFTGLNNGTVSAIISVVRTLIIQVIMIYLLPLIFGKEAIWYTVIIAEFLSLIVSIIFLLTNKKKYSY